MRRILFTETDFSALPNPPAGFKYIGFDGPNFTAKDETGISTPTGGGGGLLEVSYSELRLLIGSQSLTPGSYYLIDDFRTCYDQPDYDINGDPYLVGNYKQGKIRPLIVFALSTSEISTDAFQSDFPEDRIKYDWSISQTEITGGTAYGMITERVDKYNNRTDYDHRDVRFKRYRSYEVNFSPLTGTVSLSGYGATQGTVEGIDTLFIQDRQVGEVISIDDVFYKIAEVVSDTEIHVEGREIGTASSVKYYLANDYTDNYKEASIQDFIMDGEVVQGNSGNFGQSSMYFTNTYPGFFSLVAKDISIETFKIDSDTDGLGADGHGKVDAYNKTILFSGNTYTYYVKQVYNAGDPSVIHITIINTDGVGTTHSYDTSSENDFDQITGIESATELHYLLLSQHSGEPLAHSRISTVVSDYLNIILGKSITNILLDLNSNYENITDNVPDVYFFNDCTNNGSDISDGGGDMYDTGNEIYTNLSDGDYIPYTHTQMDLDNLYICLEYKENNIINDYSRECRTFESGSHENYITGKLNHDGEGGFAPGNQPTFKLVNNVFSESSYNRFIGKIYNNTITGSFYNNTANGDFFHNIFRNGASGNKFGTFRDNLIYNNFEGNNIDGYFYSNIIYGDFYHNNIKGGSSFYDQNGFNNNYIYSDFILNNIGAWFEENTIGSKDYIGDSGFGSNEIGWSMKGNLILNDFDRNTIKDVFYSNEIDSFRDNKVESYFIYNNILGSFYNNTISTWFSNNDLIEFFNNNIGSSFGSNNIGNNFAYNIIGADFYNNNIESDFGFGGSVARGNKIGNYFQNNNIGEYFYDNTITDIFYENDIASHFQLNNIKSQNLNGVNFTTNNGNILSFSYSFAGELPEINPDNSEPIWGVTFSGVSGTYSYGGSTASVVDATFDIYVTDDSYVMGGGYLQVTLNNPGNYYLSAVGYTASTITIVESKFANGYQYLEDSLVITINQVSDLPSVYAEYNTEIFKRAGGVNRLSYYDSSDVLTITDIDK